eukprot:CAMPEP_0197193442 /NCGR_PEP_ID=MMETSP1423-20130617/27174_1 /TAXON_ID=476441 /ORGANISM="Pseudo-nitzschia heimii, Strain UNC1101" /LENGTH=815 /DNA_ID=CAMNT_0042646631 /DNA_START=103 /DNA_END=2550 /DNA_ORIENTATION=+
MASTATANGGVPSSVPMANSGSSSFVDKTGSSPSASSANSGTSPGGPTGTSPASGSVFKKAKHVAFWDVDGPGVDAWIGTIPGPFQHNGTKTAFADGDGNDTNANEGVVGSGTITAAARQVIKNASNSKNKHAIPPEITKRTWQNLRKAVLELNISLRPKNEDNVNIDSQPPAKKQKRSADDAMTTKTSSNDKKKAREFYSIIDPYNLYYHTIRIVGDGEENEDEEDLIEIEDDAARDLKTTIGGKLSQLTISGIINGLAGFPSGIVNKKVQLLPGVDSKISDAIPTAGGASLTVLRKLAHSLFQSVQAQIEADVLVTTPIRIQEMLAKDLSNVEFKSIRKRIYDTVILGKGLSQPEGIDIPTAAAKGVHALEKFKKCNSCGATDQSVFVMDRKNGDIICSACGTVISESLMHEGSQFRKFEGEADRNHHGDTPNSLYSNAHNMATTLGGVQVNTGAGVGGFGSQRGRGLETVLRNAHSYTELNICQFGKGDRRTRTGYKDKQKKDAFIQMANVGDALNLHEAVVQRGKELFAGFRDDRELIQQFKGVIAACLCEAFDQLSTDGRSILKQKQIASGETSFSNPRANRRNQLHHAKLAGKGGLLLDMESVKNQNKGNGDDSSLTKKTISSWTLDDCRSWLMEVSRTVAQEWVDERKKGAKNIPEGTREELEGKMVEHSIALCDTLEAELSRAATKIGGRGRIVTPRVNDMAKLGIKWQHAHERGSGGKGGVGGSGNNQPQRSGRTAGQILILKSTKKLGQIVQDKIAGEAIHKELRTVVNKQQALKRQMLRNEATRQRLVQMKRKPWLQARAQIDD